MNKQLQKKLLSYSTLATAILAVERNTDAQVIYKRFNPPDTIKVAFTYGQGQIWGTTFDTIFPLDLINDTIADFKFHIGFYSNGYSDENLFVSKLIDTITVTADGNDKIDADTGKNYGKPICKDNNWKDTQRLVFYSRNRGNSLGPYGSYTSQSHLVQTGAFGGDTDKYLPILLNVNGDSLYGWIRLSINFYGENLIINSYAYNATPGECITAGDTLRYPASVVPPPGTNDPLIWSSDKTIYIKLNNDDLLGSLINVYDNYGRKVYSSQLNSLQTNIELKAFITGLYVIKINGKQSSFVKKIILD